MYAYIVNVLIVCSKFYCSHVLLLICAAYYCVMVSSLFSYDLV